MTIMSSESAMLADSIGMILRAMTISPVAYSWSHSPCERVGLHHPNIGQSSWRPALVL